MFYTYLLGWSNQNKYYYGVRYSKNAVLEDIGTNYFSSSRYVKIFMSTYGPPDIAEVRRVFHSAEAALKWESRVLCKLDVLNNDKYLNRWNNNMVPLNIEGPFPFEDKQIQSMVDDTLRKKYKGRGSGSQLIKEKVFKTNTTRYGVHHTLKLDSVAKARVAGSLKKYGTVNPFFSAEFQKNVTNPMHVSEHREKHKRSMEAKDWTERNRKMKETNLKRYGVTNPMNRPEMKRRPTRKIICPFGCNANKEIDVRNFTRHMSAIHSWTKEEVEVYKREN